MIKKIPTKAFVVSQDPKGPWMCDWCGHVYKDRVDACKGSREGCPECYDGSSALPVLRSAPTKPPVKSGVVRSSSAPSVVEVSYLRNGDSLEVLPSTGYAHCNRIQGLEIGDIVTVPSFGDYRSPQKAVVVRLGSDYIGRLESTITLVAKKSTSKE